MTSVPDELSDRDYDRITGLILSGIEAVVDQWLQADVIDVDAQRTGGMLDLTLPDGSKLIINTQPPLQELWLAARNGGYHFKCHAGRWLDREGVEFFDRLSACASEQANQPLRIQTTA